VQACDCQLLDLYCEYGFEKDPSHQSLCIPMVVGSTPKCTAIDNESYKMSTTHMRLPHNAKCPNIAKLIPDTDGNVRPCTSTRSICHNVLPS
jgi:hypothetical protein